MYFSMYYTYTYIMIYTYILSVYIYVFFFINSEGFYLTLHCEFPEYWNTQKSVWRIWQHFSWLLDEGIHKIWKKLNSRDGFLRADYIRQVKNVLPDWIGCAILQVAQKATWEFNFFHIFGIPSSSIHEKRCETLQTLFWVFQYSRNS